MNVLHECKRLLRAIDRMAKDVLRRGASGRVVSAGHLHVCVRVGPTAAGKRRSHETQIPVAFTRSLKDLDNWSSNFQSASAITVKI